MLVYRQIFLTILALLIFSPKIYGINLQLGLSAIEEGDDRLHPAATLHVQAADFMAFRSHYYGQTLGPLEERTLLLSGNFLFPFMKFKGLEGGIGPSLIHKTTRVMGVDYDGGTAQTTTPGLSLSIFWSPFPKYAVTLAWESQLFLAGPSSILLTTARRQAISISGGYQW